jgi:hypothetical protein
MKAVILVPFKTDSGPRLRNWMHARSLWAELDLDIEEATTDPFERAASRNLAAANAGDWDVALFADADILLGSPDQADAAIMRCYRTGAYTVAYSHLRYLTEEGTESVVNGKAANFADTDESVGLTWECCFAVRRDIWDETGGFDERFRGWGGQVSAFFYAAATFGGRERIHGSAYHMAHPLVDRALEPHFQANCELAERYKAAVDDPAAMREILKERA